VITGLETSLEQTHDQIAKNEAERARLK
jgi:hypothetical protein